MTIGCSNQNLCFLGSRQIAVGRQPAEQAHETMLFQVLNYPDCIFFGAESNGVQNDLGMFRDLVRIIDARKIFDLAPPGFGRVCGSNSI